MKENADPNGARYTQRPLPPYRHLPFQNAHPFLDEGGHSYGETLTPPQHFAADGWRRCDDYLYAIDLFNHGFWWEAHERLKPLCLAAGRESQTGLFIQGLIRIAAALLKLSTGEAEAAETLAQSGFDALASGTGPCLGVDPERLKREVADCLAGSGDVPVIRLVGIAPGGR